MNDEPIRAELVAVMRKLKTLRGRIERGDSQQRRRLADRYDLAARARELGATWAAINEACGVANMQATLSGKRPEVD